LEDDRDLTRRTSSIVDGVGARPFAGRARRMHPTTCFPSSTDVRGGAMSQISTRQNLTTLINVFIVDPARQQTLVDVLTRATDETIRRMPGFVSASIHRSIDGTRVTNYAQWRSRDDLEAMLRDPAAQPHLKEATALATSVEPHLYEVVSVRNGRHAPSRAAVGAAAVGALAVGACAVGAFAVGRVAIGAVAVGAAWVRTLSLHDVDIKRLRVRELVIDEQ
jgi:quinol monooxygenase YgiN